MIIVIDLLSDINENFLSIVCLVGLVCVAKVDWRGPRSLAVH